jgi:hypothetical protein
MSLQQVPGGPTLAQARRFANPPPGSGVSGKYTTVNVPGRANSNEFPIVPFAPDKYDTISSIKQAVGDNDNEAFGKKWMVPFTDADAQYLLRKQAQVQNANYERWLWQQYDVEDPAQAWIFQQIAPEQFEKRKQLILYQQNLATKYALLRLYGVKNEEDLMLKYLVDTKQIELPQGPVWDPKKWMQQQSGLSKDDYEKEEGYEVWAKRYTAGMFSPLRYVNQKQVGHHPDNYADPLSFSKDKITGQIFAGTNHPSAPYNSYGKNPVGPDGWIPFDPQPYRAGTTGIGYDTKAMEREEAERMAGVEGGA